MMEEQSNTDSEEKPIEYDPAGVARLEKYRDEMIMVFHKSQDLFEKQLSFISAGALTLSVGFVGDIVGPLGKSTHKAVLGTGWGLLVVTLLLNCISNLLGARYANKNIKEAIPSDYEPAKIIKREKRIICLNWFTTSTMISGIAAVISFIIKNTLT
jgi:hypothetical protein